MTKTVETYISRATTFGLVCNAFLVLIKGVTLLVVNSLAIAIDLGISFVGLTVSVILYYSMKLASRPADLVHNYGYGKVENVCEGMEGVVLIGIALAMSSQALVSLFHLNEIHSPWLGTVTSMVSTVTNLGGAYYISKMGQLSKSPAIKAEGLHWRMEGFISLMIAMSFVVSMLLTAFGRKTLALYIDPLTALLVSVFVVVPSVTLAKTAFFKLLDASVEEGSQIEILKHLGRHIASYCEFKDLKTRTAGRKKFVEFTIIVPEDISFRKAHVIVKNIESAISSGLENCDVSVRTEPCRMDCEFVRKGEKCPYA
jgi:cation diffusion facilitator family transporter